MNVSRVSQPDQVTLGGICFKRRTNYCMENAEQCLFIGYNSTEQCGGCAEAQVSMVNKTMQLLYLGQSYFTKGKIVECSMFCSTQTTMDISSAV